MNTSQLFLYGVYALTQIFVLKVIIKADKYLHRHSNVASRKLLWAAILWERTDKIPLRSDTI